MTSLRDLLHEEYYSDGDLVLFRCDKCGYTSMSLGWIHSHIETHRGYTRLNIQLPFTKTAPANVGELMKLTTILRITQAEELDSLDQVEGL